MKSNSYHIFFFYIKFSSMSLVKYPNHISFWVTAMIEWMNYSKGKSYILCLIPHIPYHTRNCEVVASAPYALSWCHNIAACRISIGYTSKHCRDVGSELIYIFLSPLKQKIAHNKSYVIVTLSSEKRNTRNKRQQTT